MKRKIRELDNKNDLANYCNGSPFFLRNLITVSVFGSGLVKESNESFTGIGFTTWVGASSATTGLLSESIIALKRLGWLV